LKIVVSNSFHFCYQGGAVIPTRKGSFMPWINMMINQTTAVSGADGCQKTFMSVFLTTRLASTGIRLATVITVLRWR
jgi:hypothetical protein